MSSRSTRSQYGLTLRIVGQETNYKRCPNSDETVAEIGVDILFDPSVLDTYCYDGWKPVHHDLLLMCAAVEYADRRCKRRATRWSRPFRIILPVLDLAAWQQRDVTLHLQATLRLLTGDDWRFSFVQRLESAPNRARQRALPFPGDRAFAIAYSDGVDSRCVSALLDTGSSAVRVRVASTKASVRLGERPFDQIPFSVKLDTSRESGARSRGFKFASITAIAAHLSGVRKIVVPESGQGALGPVLLPLHNTYADYRNHPTFFRQMERFIDSLLGYSLVYEQPRLWYTKGETIAAFLAQSETARESILNTRSCWQQRWNARFAGKLRQCGLCVACLLRRMSMHAADVTEPPDTYLIDDLTVSCYKRAVSRRPCKRLSRTLVEYGSVGARHLQRLAEMAHLPYPHTRPHVFELARATGLSETHIRQALRRLLLQHAQEWCGFIRAQGPRSFIPTWTIGARNARS